MGGAYVGSEGGGLTFILGIAANTRTRIQVRNIIPYHVNNPPETQRIIY